MSNSDAIRFEAEAEAVASEEMLYNGENEMDAHVDRYYANVVIDPGTDFYDASLHQFHVGINIEQMAFHSAPASFDCIEDPSLTAPDHPLRWVLNAAVQHTKIRVLCYSLTDPVALELLVHAGLKCTVQVILYPDERNKNVDEIKKFLDNYGKKLFHESLEIRIAAQSTSSSRGSMHEKTIITESHAVYGSYNLSKLARAGNWESVVVVDSTPATSVQAFDTIWASIATNQIEVVFPVINGPPGKKRAARDKLRLEAQRRMEEAEKQQSQIRAQSRSSSLEQ